VCDTAIANCATQSGTTCTTCSDGFRGDGTTVCAPICTPGSTTFSYTGAAEAFIVPERVGTLHFSVAGAGGGDQLGGGAPAGQTTGIGGAGGLAQGQYTATAGEALFVVVGGKGVLREGSAFGGGGQYPYKMLHYSGPNSGGNGGGGGGLSGVFTGEVSTWTDSTATYLQAQALLIAGGGGGGGRPGGQGGDGSGGTAGAAGVALLASCDLGGGGGGTQTTGGANTYDEYWQGGTGATAGSALQGGRAGGDLIGDTGSGGGGYYGGGGGGMRNDNGMCYYSGGGGSGYERPDNFLNMVRQSGTGSARNTDGSVTATWTCA
jgi:hypothetical protein